MEKQDLDTLIKGLQGISALEQMLEKKSQRKKECSECKEDQDDEEEEESCEILDSLIKEINEFFQWLFGENVTGVCEKKRAIKLWKKLHPELPLPRIMQTQLNLNSHETSMALIIDAYPLFLAEKKSKSN